MDNTVKSYEIWREKSKYRMSTIIHTEEKMNPKYLDCTKNWKKMIQLTLLYLENHNPSIIQWDILNLCKTF
jgi:hypothetical protein